MAPLPAPPRRGGLATALVALLILLGVLAGGLLLGRRLGKNSPPSYHEVAYKSGFLTTARFGPDGRTILYSAAWGSDPIQGFLQRTESPDAVSLGPPGAAVLAVSPSGEVALALDCKRSTIGNICGGTLAKIPLTGGAPRELYEHIQQADWSSDGSALAVVSQVENKSRLESPPGKVLYETRGYVSDPRFSPKGDAIAFFDHPIAGNDIGSVAVMNLSGKKQTLTAVVEAAGGLAWSPSGKEIWFSANVGGDIVAVYAVNFSGQQRLVARAPEVLRIHDVFRDGRALISQGTLESRVFALEPGETRERDLTWLGFTTLGFLSGDGRTLLFSEQSLGYSACLRRTDGTPVVRLGDGVSASLSPDGKWALVRQFPKIGEVTPRLPYAYVLIPTGVGEPRRIVYEGIDEYRGAGFLPDGREILFLGRRGQEFRFIEVRRKEERRARQRLRRTDLLPFPPTVAGYWPGATAYRRSSPWTRVRRLLRDRFRGRPRPICRLCGATTDARSIFRTQPESSAWTWRPAAAPYGRKLSRAIPREPRSGESC